MVRRKGNLGRGVPDCGGTTSWGKKLYGLRCVGPRVGHQEPAAMVWEWSADKYVPACFTFLTFGTSRGVTPQGTGDCGAKRHLKRSVESGEWRPLILRTLYFRPLHTDRSTCPPCWEWPNMLGISLRGCDIEEFTHTASLESAWTGSRSLHASCPSYHNHINRDS